MRKTRLKVKQGKIIPNGVKLESHEMDTVLYFTELGKDIELIPTSHTPGNMRADFVMDSREWEMKSPTRDAKRTIERTFYEASRQSSNIIMDLRRVPGDMVSSISTLEKCFRTTRKVRSMYIITKSQELKLYKK